MTRDQLKAQVDELMRKYDMEEIDSEKYFQKMMQLITSFKIEDYEE